MIFILPMQTSLYQNTYKLEINFDSKLTSATQTSTIVRSCFLILQWLREIWDFLSKEELANLVTCFSCLMLTSATVFPMVCLIMNRIIYNQCWIVRPVLGAENHDHISPLTYQLRWLKVSERTKYKRTFLVFKPINQPPPVYLQECFVLTELQKLSLPLSSSAINHTMTPQCKQQLLPSHLLFQKTYSNHFIMTSVCNNAHCINAKD